MNTSFYQGMPAALPVACMLLVLLVLAGCNQKPTDSNQGGEGNGSATAPEPTGFGAPSTWAEKTTITPHASGPGATLTATLINKDMPDQQITVTAGAGERVRARDQNGNLTKISLREYTDGCTAIENMYVDQSGNADLRKVTLTLNQSTPRTLFSGDIEIIARSRWPFWHQPPKAHSFDNKLIPPLGAGAGNAEYLDDYNEALKRSYNTSKIQNIGLFNKAMGTTGGRPDLGLLTQWDVAYIKNPSPGNTQVLRGQGDASGAWPMHALDPNTGMMVKVTDHPGLDVFHPNSPGNPAAPAHARSPFSLSQARAHAPTFGYLQALVFKKKFYIEETEFWANYLATYSDHYRLNDGAGIQNLYHTQTRGFGWSLRQTVQAAVVSKKFNTPFKNYFATLTDEYATQLDDLMDERIANHEIRTLRRHNYPPNRTGLAPWQEDFVGMSAGYAAYLGFPKFKDAFMKYGAFFTSRINASPHEFATTYQIKVEKPDGSIVKNWQEAIKQSLQNGSKPDGDSHYKTMYRASQYPEGSLAFNRVINKNGNVAPGALMGYPASNHGFAAYYGAALGFCKYFGVDGADKAWKTWNDNLIMNYRHNPMFFIDPEVARRRRPINN